MISNRDDTYPIPSHPTLSVEDLADSARWYQQVLGFRHVATIAGRAGRPLLVHLRWARYADLFLTNVSQSEQRCKGVGITLNFTMPDGPRDVDQLARQVSAWGVRILCGPVDRPWNVRELVLLDPDGYRLSFTQLIDHRVVWPALQGRLQSSAGRLTAG